MKIGIVPLTWHAFARENPDEWPQERIWRECREAGFEAVSATPKKDESPKALLERLASFELKPAPGFYGGDFWSLDERENHLRNIRAHSETARALGLTEIFVCVGGWTFASRENGATRPELAGRVGLNDGLNDEEMRDCGAVLNEMGAVALESGVSICVHNHVGALIETRVECDALEAHLDPEKVFWGPDFGHLHFGGADCKAFARDYGPRIRAVHLKDVNPAVLEQGRAQKWDLSGFVQAGVWTELGRGAIDFLAVFEALKAANYSGWILSEIDCTQLSTPLESARICRDFLRETLA